MKKSISILIIWLSLCQANELFDEKLYQDVLDPELCARQVESMDKLVFYDSSFREPEGLLGGNFVSFGNYQRCLAINQNFPGNNIEGKYCFIRAQMPTYSNPTFKIPRLGGVSGSSNITWTEYKFNWSSDEIFRFLSYTNKYVVTSRTNATDRVIESVTLSLAVCVPKSCTADALLRPYAEHPLINFTYSEQFCRLPGDKTFVAVDYVAFGILSLLGLFTVISTAYELRHIFIFKKDPATASQLLSAWSLYRNTASLLTFAEHPRALACLDGIRTLAMMQIILFHSLFAIFECSANKLEYTQTIYQADLLWASGGCISVDTFFVMSGMLLVYSVANKMEQKSLLRNLHMFYVNRYVRLFPLLVGTVLLQASIIQHMLDGPYWYHVTINFANCRKYWWRTFLYVQNFVNPSEECVGPTWYLGVDMHLYMLSPLVLYWVLGSARAAWTALTTAVLASLAATLAICFYLNDTWWLTGYVSRSYMEVYYKNVVTRSPTFFIGMLLGYLLHVVRGKKLQLPKWIVFLGHTLALLLFFYAFYVIRLTIQPERDNQPALNAHNALFRACWALALCWLIFACAHGYGGPVNWFLSLKLWRFPARISYAMYLYSSPTQIALVGAIVSPCYFNPRSLLERFFVELAYTAVVSVMASVVIEAPALTLYKMLLTKPQSKKD